MVGPVLIGVGVSLSYLVQPLLSPNELPLPPNLYVLVYVCKM